MSNSDVQVRKFQGDSDLPPGESYGTWGFTVVYSDGSTGDKNNGLNYSVSGSFAHIVRAPRGTKVRVWVSHDGDRVCFSAVSV